MQLYYFPEEKLRCGLAHRPYRSQTVGPSEFLSEKESMEIINWITQRIKQRGRMGQKETYLKCQLAWKYNGSKEEEQGVLINLISRDHLEVYKAVIHIV